MNASRMKCNCSRTTVVAAMMLWVIFGLAWSAYFTTKSSAIDALEGNSAEGQEQDLTPATTSMMMIPIRTLANEQDTAVGSESSSSSSVLRAGTTVGAQKPLVPVQHPEPVDTTPSKISCICPKLNCPVPSPCLELETAGSSGSSSTTSTSTTATALLNAKNELRSRDAEIRRLKLALETSQARVSSLTSLHNACKKSKDVVLSAATATKSSTGAEGDDDADVSSTAFTSKKEITPTSGDKKHLIVATATERKSNQQSFPINTPVTLLLPALPTPMSTAAAVIDVLRPYLFPHPGSLNAARRAWIRGRIDWHDMVPDVYAIHDEAEATKVLQRQRREAAKDRLLTLLIGLDAPKPLPKLDAIVRTKGITSNGVSDPAETALSGLPMQKELMFRVLLESQILPADDIREMITGLRRVKPDTTTGGWILPLPSTVSKDAYLAVSNTTLVDKVSSFMRIDKEDVGELRSPQSDYGPLGKMMACGRVRDPCIIHATARACVDDEFCGWCGGDARICVDRMQGTWPEKKAGTYHPICPGPLLVTADSVPSEYISRRALQSSSGSDSSSSAITSNEKNKKSAHVKDTVHVPKKARSASLFSAPLVTVHKVDPRNSGRSISTKSVSASECSFIVTRRRPAVLAFNDGNSKMAFHFFTETAPGWQQVVTSYGGADYLALDIYVPAASWNEFPQMVSPFSDSCPRVWEEVARAHSKGNITLCYSSLKGPALKSGSAGGSSMGAGSITAEDLFGQSDPELVFIDPITLKVVRQEAGEEKDVEEIEEEKQEEGNFIYNENQSKSPLSSVFPQLEDPIQAVEAGKRLGLAGLAAMVSYTSRLPVWRTTGGSAELSSRGLTLSSFQDGAKKLVSGLISSADSSSSFTKLLLHSLLLQEESTPSATSPPLVTFITRRNKRFILNEDDLVRVALALGADVRLITLESTPLYEQLALLHRTTILVGMHGSGLINSQIMRPGGAIIQLIPYNVYGASPFFQPAASSAGVGYYEVPQKERSSTIPHYHFLDSSHAKDHETMLTAPQGSGCCGQSVFFSFWINQDGIIDAVSFGKTLRTALEKAKTF